MSTRSRSIAHSKTQSRQQSTDAPKGHRTICAGLRVLPERKQLSIIERDPIVGCQGLIAFSPVARVCSVRQRLPVFIGEVLHAVLPETFGQHLPIGIFRLLSAHNSL